MWIDLSQEEYNSVMEFSGKKIWALQVGHHMEYNGVSFETPTIWPERQDCTEELNNYINYYLSMSVRQFFSLSLEDYKAYGWVERWVEQRKIKTTATDLK